jgi:hypothetical protein
MTSRSPEQGPDFIGIGLQKAGTRWLYTQLRAHPSFWLPPIKELHFFDRRFPASRVVRRREDHRLNEADRLFLERVKNTPRMRRPSTEVYATLFEQAGSKITGDITPAYGGLSEVLIQQIATAFPNVRIVLMLRDPISRAWSQVNDMANKELIPHRDLHTASGLREAMRIDVVERGSYPSRIYKRWMEAFGADRMLTFFLDDVAADSEHARAKIFEMFGVDGSLIDPMQSSSDNNKQGRHREPMTAEVREAFVSLFAEELQECARVFGGPAAQWPAKYGLTQA